MQNSQKSLTRGKSVEAESGSKPVLYHRTEQREEYIINDQGEQVLRIITDVYLDESIPNFMTELQLWHHTDWELEQLRLMLQRRGLEKPDDETLKEWRDAINLS